MFPDTKDNKSKSGIRITYVQGFGIINPFLCQKLSYLPPFSNLASGWLAAQLPVNQ